MSKTIISCISDNDLLRYIQAIMLHYGYNTAMDDIDPDALKPLPADALLVIFPDSDQKIQFLTKTRPGGCPPSVIIYEREELRERLDNSGSHRAVFIKRPFVPQEFDLALRDLLQSSAEDPGFVHGDYFFGEDEKILKIHEFIEKISRTSITVLIQGESGTGKDVVARLIHKQSARAKNSFVKVNGAAIPKSLLESELFGYEKGAFTGAFRLKPGKFDLADGGTLFLDEVGDLPLSVQAKLLQVLEGGEFSRLGSEDSSYVDVRIIATSRNDLLRQVKAEKFRKDLYYRLNVASVSLPSLRHHRADIPLLVEFFLEKYCLAYGKPYIHLSEKVYDLFFSYAWPGNVRELESIIKNLVVLGDESSVYADLANRRKTISSRDRAETGCAKETTTDGVDSFVPGHGLSLKKLGERYAGMVEAEVIKASLQKTRWNRRACAAMLKISYKSLLNKIREYGLLEDL
ncbi:MAG: sigma-54 dependent transcriptional regulator [Pseudomonadota bacterium]